MPRLATELHQRRRAIALSAIIGLAVAACGGGSTGGAPTSATPGASASTPAGSPTASASTPTSSADASASPSASLGPATAAFTLAGPKGLAGAATKLTIRCGTPSHEGLTIDMFGQTVDAAVALRVTLTTAHIAVRISSGSGDTFFGRDFVGAGLTDFDPRVGGTIDSPLAPLTVAGQDAGTLGALTSIKGTVACGNQTAGTSTLVFSGDSPEGPIEAGLDPVSVECIPYAQGDRVSVIGMTSAESTPVLMIATLAKDNLSVAAWPKGKASRFYTVQAPGAVSLVSGGAHVDGLAAEPYNPTAPLALHVVGDVTCGWTAAP